MSFQRLPDWTERHIEFIASRRSMRFIWGHNDCFTFFADHTIAITGVDFAARWRGYKTERGAMSRVRKCGGLRRGLVAAAELEEKPIGLAQRGDGVLADMLGRETAGVCTGDGYWCAPGADSLIFRPMREVLAVYAIGS